MAPDAPDGSPPESARITAAFDELTRANLRPAPVVLVSMPFGPLRMPSLGLSLLQAGLRRTGIDCRIVYFTFPFARLMDIDLYDEITGMERTANFVGEWLFNKELVPGRTCDVDGYVRDVLERNSPKHRTDHPVSADEIDQLLAIRHDVVPGFLDSCAEATLALGPRLVGFTSTFQQHVASLVLASRLKERDPDLFVVLGGANCEAAMGRETLRQSRGVVDAVVSGEGDVIFPSLVTSVLAGRPLQRVAGLFTRETSELRISAVGERERETVVDLDALPIPSYEDYFAQFDPITDDLGSARGGLIEIPFESSRGCWWGEQKHCTFCGLNGTSMQFRAKSPHRLIAELEHLATSYAGYRLSAVDNILAREYFSTVLPMLAERGHKFGLFYETKANLSEQDLDAMRAAGFTEFQPGIESLSTPVLQLMRKGTTGIRNIQLLKHAEMLGVVPQWNWIWGFPKEEPGEYAWLATIIPQLEHLRPPNAIGPVGLHRFSPFFQSPDEFGLREVEPFPTYFYIYEGLEESAVRNLAYYFTFRYDDRDHSTVSEYSRPLARRLLDWQKAYRTSAYFLVDDAESGVLVLVDLRPGVATPLRVLHGIERAVVLSCDRAVSTRELSHKLHTLGHDDEALGPLLDAFVSEHVLSREGSVVLTLAVDVQRYLAATDPESGEAFFRHEKIKMMQRVLELEGFDWAATWSEPAVLDSPAVSR